MNCGEVSTDEVERPIARPALALAVRRNPGWALLTLAALIVTSTWAGPAYAARKRNERDRVWVMRVESTQVNDDTRKELTQTLSSAANAYKHFEVRTSKVDPVEEMFEFECTEAGVDCLTKIGRKHKVDKVIYSEVSKDGEGKLEWSLRVVGLEPVPRVEQSTRHLLEGQDATKIAEKALLVLIGPVDLPTRGDAALGTLAVRLAGGGVALVYVDDKLLGRTSVGGLTAQLPAGRYRLRVVRAGYREFQTIVVVAAEKATELAVALELAPEPTRPPPGAPTKDDGVASSPWFWVGVGAVALAGAGVAAYLLMRGDDAPEIGKATFTFDSSTAHLDPIFGAR